MYISIVHISIINNEKNIVMIIRVVYYVLDLFFNEVKGVNSFIISDQNKAMTDFIIC
jgi:hypothetical protein